MTPSVSFEFFPPKTEAGEAALLATAQRLKGLAPAFVSVTFGAGGSTREPTAKAVARLQDQLGFDVTPHIPALMQHSRIPWILRELTDHRVSASW